MIRAIVLCLLLAGAARAAEPEQPPLPPASVTRQSIASPGGKLDFTAAVGVTKIGPASAQAQVVTYAYTLDGADAHTRPVTFAFNGGPGSASLYLHLGALGPWRVPLADASASMPPVAVDNAETWLGFTDIVVIDAPGTGFSRVSGEDAQKHFWSVDGDVQGFAAVIRKWLDANNRQGSPVFIAGESYGGIRGPRLVRRLSQGEGVGVSGLLLVSPLLDYGGRSAAFDPLSYVTRLPSEVAAARELHGSPVRSRADVQDAENYALGDYLADQMHAADPAAVARTSGKLAGMTGLDRAALARSGGRIDREDFLRDVDRAHGLIGSAYDATFAEADGFPTREGHVMPDALPERVNAPLVGGLRSLLAEKLHWLPDAPYRVSNGEALHAWDFGGGHRAVESMDALRTALAADPRLRVVILHGLFDLQTPYLGTVLQLGTIAPDAGADRVRLLVVPGGHMLYTRDDSRAALRDAARALIAPGQAPQTQ